jgi:hypothetical protein
MKQSAVDWIIEEINQQQKRYIDLAKKDKSLKKEVDAILTSTTLLKIKCKQAKEMEKQQIIEFTNDFIEKHTFGDYDGIVQKNKTVDEYYKETFNK